MPPSIPPVARSFPHSGPFHARSQGARAASFDSSQGARASSLDSQESNVDLWGVPLKTRAARPVTCPERQPPETKWHQEAARRLHHAAHEIWPASAAETNFRHSGWAARRSKVADSFIRLNIPAARLERFMQCGARAYVYINRAGDRVRVAGQYCHDRNCQPCATARSRAIAANLRRQLRDMSGLKFITLTLRHSPRPLASQVKRLLTCARNLRNQRFWKQAVTGGAQFVEVKHGPKGWHPHLHMICQAKFIPQAQLSAAWHATTGDSFVCDIRAVDQADAKEDVARYVAKYASKPLDRSIYTLPATLDEAISALRGTRLCTTFGDWRGFQLEANPDDPEDWKPLCSLERALHAIAADEPWARILATALLPRPASPNRPSG
jgi:hypothetical protein